MTLELRVLGSLRLSATDGRDLSTLIRQPKRTAVLAYLAAAVPRGFQRRDTLLALFWPDLDDPHARAALNQTLYVLRNALGDQAVLTRGDSEVGLSSGVVWSDVGTFESALDSGRLADALALYGGDLLDGHFLSGAPAFERWLDAERGRLRQRASEGAWAFAEQLAASGDAVAAARWARRGAALLPADETAARRLMTFLARLGDRAAALRSYEAFAWQLGKDYELEPSAETRDLAAAIRLQAEPTKAPVTSAPRPALPLAETPRSGERRFHTRRFAAIVTAGVVGLAALWSWLGPGPEAADQSPLPRIAVLPFQNLGRAEDEHFADGITEEITARLGQISGLRVISRTSTVLYKDRPRSIRQIGEELDVGTVLEGSVRIERSRARTEEVHVITQLIRVSDDAHLWSERHAAPLVPGQIVRVQVEIAERVAQALDVTLLGAERQLLATPSTENLQAYVYYLRGNEYRRQGFDERETRTAIHMYEQAVAADSGYARAYAALARSHAQMYWFFYDRSPARLAAMERAAQRAIQLSPNHPETQIALGYVHYWGHLAHEKALAAFRAAERLQPSNAEVHHAIANVHKRQGALAEAVAHYRQSLVLDPRQANAPLEIGNAFALMGDPSQAARYYDQAHSLAPEWPQPYWRRARLHLTSGDTQRARAVLEAPTVPVSDQMIGYHAALIDTFDGHYDAALDRMGAVSVEAYESQWQFVPVAQLRGQIHGLLGHADLRQAYYDSARIVAERRVRARPEEANYRSALGIAYAGLGRRAEAIREARTAVSQLPITADALRGLYRIEDLARVYVMVGDHDAGLAVLEQLVDLPGGRSIPFLDLDPVWEPIREREGFRSLLRR